MPLSLADFSNVNVELAKSLLNVAEEHYSVLQTCINIQNTMSFLSLEPEQVGAFIDMMDFGFEIPELEESESEPEDDENSDSESDSSEDEGVEDEIDKEDQIVSDMDSQCDSEDAEDEVASEEDADTANPLVEDDREAISAMESALVSEKPWQMRGEINAAMRPKDSLLDQVVDFDVALKRAPEPSENLDDRIEAMIRHRIIEREFDDVVARKAPETVGDGDELATKPKTKELRGLADEYADEFIRQAGLEAKEVPADVQALRKEVLGLADNCFNLLDSLVSTHHHHQIRADLTVTGKQGEDVRLAAVASGTIEAALAAEANAIDERDRRARVDAGRTELTQEERRARRSAKKDRQKKRNAGQEEARQAKVRLVRQKEAGGLEKTTRREDAIMRRNAEIEMARMSNVESGKGADGSNYQMGKSVFGMLQASQEKKGKKK
ncbi:Mpp10 protein [Carpediemonas membranifera]|uniref:Mpp10 protein n=1 Tax=Carpediemonas membranifera TaxID=201153 RepID=A0A8J6B8U0_9EUKA|nr:Mpp10 protein [Carpediemonas membranifera]|eukprot:KAG9395132.1 Mpp10 protein [Carpediemonas membranifera]